MFTWLDTLNGDRSDFNVALKIEFVAANAADAEKQYEMNYSKWWHNVICVNGYCLLMTKRLKLMCHSSHIIKCSESAFSGSDWNRLEQCGKSSLQIFTYAMFI